MAATPAHVKVRLELLDGEDGTAATAFPEKTLAYRTFLGVVGLRWSAFGERHAFEKSRPNGNPSEPGLPRLPNAAA